MNVLIIHRQSSFLQSVKEKFLLGGWQVTTSNNGLDGLLTARHHRFDLVLCGIDLPVVSGTEVIRSIRMLSQNRHTPVFFISTDKESPSQLKLIAQLEANVMNEKEISESRKFTWLDN